MEHPGALTEHQRNTSGTPRNNMILNDEEQLHLNVDYKLKFNKYLKSIFKKVGRNVNAFLKIMPYKNFEKDAYSWIFFYFTVVFYYCPLVRMFCSHKTNTKINHFQESCRCIVCSDKASSFGKLLETDRSVPIHIRNLPVLAADLSKESKNLTPNIFSEFFFKTKCSV